MERAWLWVTSGSIWLPWWLSGKESTFQSRWCKRRGFDPWVRKIPWGGNGNLSSILAWKRPWTEEPGGLQSMGSQRIGCNWAPEHTHTDSTSPRALRPQTGRLIFWTLVFSSVKGNDSSLESRYGGQSGVGIEKLGGSLSPGSGRGQRPGEEQSGQCATGGADPA